MHFLHVGHNAVETPQGYVVQWSINFTSKSWMTRRKTFDCGITIVFQVTNVSSRSDRHPEVSENRYYGYLNDILECDFKSFKLVMFKVKWYRLQMNERDPERTIIEHDNGFTMVNTRTLERVLSFMFFQANVSRSFTQMFQVKWDGHMLLDMIQEEGL
jgi:hypothetical protein